MCNKKIKGGIMLASRTLGPPVVARAGPKKRRDGTDHGPASPPRPIGAGAKLACMKYFIFRKDNTMKTKKMNKFLALFLAIMMTMAVLTTTAFAAGTNSITVTNPTQGATYSIYKIFDVVVTVIDGAANGYLYTVDSDSDWLPFVQQFDAEGSEAHYFDFEEDTTDGVYVVKATEDFHEDSSVKAFVKKAQAFAANMTADQSLKAEANVQRVTFDNLDFGYYLVVSSVGTVAGVHNLDEAVIEIEEKNDLPSITKAVKKTDVGLGDTVTYTIEIAAEEGALNYVVHDTMDEALTFNEITGITHDPIEDGKVTHDIDALYYTLNKNCSDGCTFELSFSQEHVCDKLMSGDIITVEYTATVNAKAAKTANTNLTNSTPIENNVYLSHGATHELKTGASSVEVYTYGFDVVKTDKSNTIITGAKFKLYDAETNGNEIKVVWDQENGFYRKAVGQETGVEIEAGNVRVLGLENGTYYLEETEAPTGYYPLNARQTVTIEGKNNYTTISEGKWNAGGVQIINVSGEALPETGGIGTTVFYVVGAMLVLGAGVLLVSKKHRDSES